MKRQKFMSRDCCTNSRESIFVQTPTYYFARKRKPATETRKHRTCFYKAICILFLNIQVVFIETEVTISDFSVCEQHFFQSLRLACIVRIHVYITAIGTLYSNVYSFSYLRTKSLARLYHRPLTVRAPI